MKTLLVLLFMTMTAKAQFAIGYRAEDKKSGLDIGIVGVHSSPRCRAENNCPWRIVWGSSKITGKGKAEISVLYSTGGEMLSTIAYVPAGSTDKTIHDPVFSVALASVKAIRVEVVNPKGKTVRHQFQ